MAQGLQVWNAAGMLVFDTTTQAGRLFGGTVVGASAGSISNAAIPNNIGFAFPRFEYPAGLDPSVTVAPWMRYQGVSFSGSSMSWGNEPASTAGLSDVRPNTTVYYGGY